MAIDKSRQMSDRLDAIAAKAGKRLPTVLADRAIVSLAGGMSGDWRGAQKTRQVTVLFAEDWARAGGGA